MGLKEVKSRSKLRSRSETLPEREAGDRDAEGSSNSIYGACGTRASPGHTSRKTVSG